MDQLNDLLLLVTLEFWPAPADATLLTCRVESTAGALAQHGALKFKKKVAKALPKLPPAIQERFAALVKDLKVQGPMPKGWANLSKLTENNYHCHLTYSYVACWSYENGSFLIEVYYVGSREGAPY